MPVIPQRGKRIASPLVIPLPVRQPPFEGQGDYILVCSTTGRLQTLKSQSESQRWDRLPLETNSKAWGRSPWKLQSRQVCGQSAERQSIFRSSTQSKKVLWVRARRCP